MMSNFRPVEPHGAFSIMLAAWPPLSTGDWRLGLVSPALGHEAMVAAARAVFALGGCLVATGDSAIAPVLAAIALDYEPLQAMESVERPPALLTIVESGGLDLTLRALLAPYVHRHAVQYVGAEGEALELDAESLNAELGGYRRHPLRPWIVDRFQPRGAVFIAPHGEAGEEIEMLASRDIGVAVLTETAPHAHDAERWSWFNPMREVIGDVPLNRWSEEPGMFPGKTLDRWEEQIDEPRIGAQMAMPYAFALQRLIAGWIA